MCRWIAGIVTLITACGFQSQASPGQADAAITADGPPLPDAAPGTSSDIVHVLSGDAYTGTGDLTISAPITVDTGRMSFGMLLPGVTFTPAKQDGGGLDLAILHVRKLDVHATVRVVGSRPLVVIADSFELTQTINVTPPCNAPPSPASGVGSGAIEIYARTRISISGYINTGVISGTGGTGGTGGLGGGGWPGGGSPGGDGCTEDALAGSDGTIILQSPSIENSGRLSASGGDGASANGGSLGQILMLYKTRVSAGVTTPTATTMKY